MTKNHFTACTYCKAQNPSDGDFCVTCGAPIEKPVTLKVVKPTPKKSIHPTLEEKHPEEIAQKIGEKVEDAYYVYAVGWRTFAEALAISIAAFIIGVASGATGLGYWGLLGAIAVGVTVGLTGKMFYLALISAPLGAFIGLGIGFVPLLLGFEKALPVSVTIFAAWGAILGGRRRVDFKDRNWWEKARPFLGGLGGAFFGFLGLLLGLGIEKALSLF